MKVMDWGLLIVSLCFPAVVGATVGFGAGLLMIPLLALQFGTRTAIVMVGFWCYALDFANFRKYRAHVDWDFTKKILVGGLPAVVAGALLLSSTANAALTIAFGVFILAFVAFQLCRQRTGAEQAAGLPTAPSSSPPGIPSAPPAPTESAPTYSDLPRWGWALGGISYGFLGALLGASGPIKVMMLEGTGHRKEGFVATFAATAIVSSAVKLVIYLVAGLFPPELVWPFVLGLPLIIASSYVGHGLAAKIPVHTFTLLVLGLLLFIGLNLVFDIL
jgi:uncharacterized membrane protein YfcA